MLCEAVGSGYIGRSPAREAGIGLKVEFWEIASDEST